MLALRPEKLRQIVGLLLGLEPKRRMNYTKLIKVLYIADRESIRDTGEPITGDQTWCLPRGPILSHLTDLIRGSVAADATWARCFRKEGRDLVMIGDPGQDWLCEYEVEKVKELHARHRHHSYGQLIEITHRLPECEKNAVTSGRKRISLHDILEGLGIGDQEAEIEDDARAARPLQSAMAER